MPSLLCWNVGSPSAVRAGKQAEWIHRRGDDVVVLTECKNSNGCRFLQRFFQAYGYSACFSPPSGHEFASMIASKLPILESHPALPGMEYLKERAASAVLQFEGKSIQLVGVYVPSRDASPEKILRKRTFIDDFVSALTSQTPRLPLVLCGDLNVLDRQHNPSYRFFKEWEYDFYERLLSEANLVDVFRQLFPGIQEYSWVGRTNDGYRYDYLLVSEPLLDSVSEIKYLHEPRLNSLSDHSAVVATIGL